MTAENRLEILNKLAEGEISAAEAAVLLDGSSLKEKAPVDVLIDFEEESSVKVGEKEIDQLKTIENEAMSAEAIKIDLKNEETWPIEITETERGSDILTGNGKKPRWLRIRIRDLDSGRNRVRVNLPLGLVTFGLGIARRFNADMGDFDVDEMMHLIRESERGLIVDVYDEDDNEHVEIYLD